MKERKRVNEKEKESEWKRGEREQNIKWDCLKKRDTKRERDRAREREREREKEREK